MSPSPMNACLMMVTASAGLWLLVPVFSTTVCLTAVCPLCGQYHEMCPFCPHVKHLLSAHALSKSMGHPAPSNMIPVPSLLSAVAGDGSGGDAVLVFMLLVF